MNLASWGSSKLIQIPNEFLEGLNISKNNEKNNELIAEVIGNKIILEKKQKSNYLK